MGAAAAKDAEEKPLSRVTAAVRMSLGGSHEAKARPLRGADQRECYRTVPPHSYLRSRSVPTRFGACAVLHGDNARGLAPTVRKHSGATPS